MEQFTFEESNLISIFDTSSRYTLTSELIDVITELDDEMLDIAANTLDKVSQMSDTEFAELEFHPEYKEFDEVEE